MLCGKRRKVSRAIASSGSWVLPARKTMSSSANAGEFAQRAWSRIVAIGLGAVELDRAGDVDAFPAGARVRGTARRRSSFWAAIRSISREQRGDERSDAAVAAKAAVRSSRPLTMATVAPCRRAARIRFGQSSSSASTSTSGRMRRIAAADGPTEIERAVEDA